MQFFYLLFYENPIKGLKIKDKRKKTKDKSRSEAEIPHQREQKS